MWDLVFAESRFCCFGDWTRKEGKTDRAFREFEGKVIPSAFRGRKPPVVILFELPLELFDVHPVQFPGSHIHQVEQFFYVDDSIDAFISR